MNRLRSLDRSLAALMKQPRYAGQAKEISRLPVWCRVALAPSLQRPPPSIHPSTNASLSAAESDPIPTARACICICICLHGLPSRRRVPPSCSRKRLAIDASLRPPANGNCNSTHVPTVLTWGMQCNASSSAMGHAPSTRSRSASVRARRDETREHPRPATSTESNPPCPQNGNKASSRRRPQIRSNVRATPPRPRPRPRPR